MAILNLTDQQLAYTQIAPKMLQIKAEMDKRLPIWEKLDDDKKKKWVLAALNNDKDAIMKISWQTYKYLRDNFFGDEVNNVD